MAMRFMNLAPRMAAAARAPVAVSSKQASVPAKRTMATAVAKSGAKTSLMNNIWLSDPGTYPVIIIISGALVFCFSFYFHNLATNPDIRIVKDKRKHSIIRTWGGEKWSHH